MSRKTDSRTLAVATLISEVFGDTPFSTEDASMAGIERQSLRSAQQQGLLIRIRRGLYISTSSRDRSLQARAHAALAPLGNIPAVICGRLAGDLHGLPYVTPRSGGAHRMTTEVMITKRDTIRCGYREGGSVLRRVDALPADFDVIDGIPVTSLLHSAIDVARMGVRKEQRPRAWSLPLPEALVVLDAATARLGATTPEEAATLVKSLRPRFRYGPGIRSVDAALDFLDPLAETPLESWSRGYMIVYGVPKPLTQQIIVGANGIDYRADFCWPDLMVIGEADGLEKYGSSPEEFRRAKSQELERQRALEAAGWTVVRWTWDELARDPQAVMWRILDAMQHARRRLRAS